MSGTTSRSPLSHPNFTPCTTQNPRRVSSLKLSVIYVVYNHTLKRNLFCSRILEISNIIKKLLDYDHQNPNNVYTSPLFGRKLHRAKTLSKTMLSKPSHQLMLIKRLALLLHGESSILDCTRRNLKPSGKQHYTM